MEKREFKSEDLPLYEALQNASSEYIPGDSQSFEEPIAKAYDIAYVRFSCPDFEMM